MSLYSFLPIRKLSKDAKTPKKLSTGAAGYDLYAPHPYILFPKQVCVIKLDLSIAFPDELYAEIRDRSSLAVRKIQVMSGIVY